MENNDDDGDRYIHVTATAKGTAKLYAQDWNENGKRDECTVTVDYRETVTVKRDGNFNKMVFADGKVWRCINHDMINNDTYKYNRTLHKRLCENTYNTTMTVGIKFI